MPNFGDNNWEDDGPDYLPEEMPGYKKPQPPNPIYAGRDEIYAKREQPMWNGQPIYRMDTDHIIAALAWCDRKYAAMVNNYATAHNGDMGGFYFNNITEWKPEYTNLREELNARRR